MNNSVPLCHSATVPYLPFQVRDEPPSGKACSLSLPTERYSGSGIQETEGVIEDSRLITVRSIQFRRVFGESSANARR